MNDFAFYSPTRFVFGRGAENKVGATLGLKGNTLGAFRPLDDADVANILRIAAGMV